MFSKSNNDIRRTLDLMIDRSIDECRYDQKAAVSKAAEWIAQDRRFDGYNASAVAKEAFDARQHGRQMQLDKPVQSGHNSMPGYINRSV